MTENYKNELKNPTPNLVKFIIFTVTSWIAGIVAFFIVTFFLAVIMTILGVEESGDTLATISLLAGFLTPIAFIAIGITELVKFIKKKKHNASVLEKYKDVIAAEKREEEEKQRALREQREAELRKLTEQKNQQAASANTALNALVDPDAASPVASTSVSTSSFTQNTTGALMYELDGQVVNVLQIYEDRCILIAKTTARSYAAGKFFNGTKEFFYEDLTNIQFREATETFNGYLQFDYPGAVNVSTSTFGGSGGNYSSENSFIFSPSSAPENMRYSNESHLDATNRIVGIMYQYMHKRIREEKALKKNGGSTNSVQFISAADELEKYHKLLLNGVITQEEFEAKKKQIFR